MMHSPLNYIILNCYSQFENGYAIWDLRGKAVEKHMLERFKQFLWRPHPPSLLSKEQQQQIRKSLREYNRTFDEDAADSADLIAHRRRLVDEWNAWRARCRKESTDERRGKAASTRDMKRVDEREEIEVWIDE